MTLNSNYTPTINPSFSVYVSGISPECSTENLTPAFEKFGTVTDVFVKHQGKYALITFDSEASATAAISSATLTVADATLSIVARQPRKELKPGKPSVYIHARSVRGVDKDEFNSAVEKFGEVKNVTFRESYACVTYETQEGAQNAVDAKTVQIGDKEIGLEFRRSQPRKRGRRGRPKKPQQDRPDRSNQLYVSGFPEETNQDALASFFEIHGNVEKVIIKKSRNYEKLFAYIFFTEKSMFFFQSFVYIFFCTKFRT